jgi:hypothetical protein
LAALCGRKASVARVRHEFFLENAPAAKKAGADGSNGDAKDLRGRFVRLVFEVDQHDRRFERLIELIQRALKRGTEIDSRENLVAAIACVVGPGGEGGQGLEIAIFEVDVAAFPLSGSEKYVACDGEQPATGIAARLKRMP